MTSSSRFSGLRLLTLVIALAGAASGLTATAAQSRTVALPVAAGDAQALKAGEQVAVFAGGCFWGVEAVFEHVKGVRQVSSGYAGGSAASANYPAVSAGVTRHAEAVKVVYDPAQVSYGQLLKVYFSVAHDPTQLNRQGPDTGAQYRSAIFYGTAGQKAAAAAYIAQLQRAHVFARPLVTEVTALQAFYPAEAYHQDFARRNPTHPYIVQHDAPKVRDLKASLPELYAGR